MTIVLDGTTGITTPGEAISGNLSYTGTLTGGTGVVNIGSGQVYKDASGNVGIGTSSPAVKLDVNGNIRIPYNTYLQAGDNAGGWVELVKTDTSLNTVISNNKNAAISFNISGEKARIDSSGNLLVGTTSGTGARMDVVAADEVVSFNRSAATDGVVQRWRKAGSTVGYVSTNTYSLPSDERVKTNIVNIGYGLDFINSLRPVQYNTIFQDPENEAQKNFGLIAQEVEQALADIGKSVDDVTFLEKFVPENDRESRYGLGYQNLVPVLIKAIQEQQTLITALTARITALEAPIV